MVHSEIYRIKHGWGLSPIRNRLELRALIKFCRQQLSEAEEYSFEKNTPRLQIYKKTVILSLAEKMNETVTCTCPDCERRKQGQQLMPYSNVYVYIKDHCGWYWS